MCMNNEPLPRLWIYIRVGIDISLVIVFVCVYMIISVSKKHYKSRTHRQTKYFAFRHKERNIIRMMKLAFILCSAVLVASVIADEYNGARIIERIDEKIEQIEDLATIVFREILEHEVQMVEDLTTSFDEINKKIEKIIRYYKSHVDGLVDSSTGKDQNQADCRSHFDEYVEEGHSRLAKAAQAEGFQTINSNQFGGVLHLIAKFKRSINSTKAEAYTTQLDPDQFVEQKVSRQYGEISRILSGITIGIEDASVLMDFSTMMSEVLDYFVNNGLVVIEKTYNCILSKN